MRHSGVDQWVIGLDHELPGDVVLTAQGISRHFSAFMGLVDEGSAWSPVQRLDPGPDNVANTADDAGMISVFALTNPGQRSFVYTNPDDAYNRYDAVQLIGKRRFKGWWQAQASYTWSRNEGTVGNRWHVNAARFDLGSPGRFVNPNSFINAYGNATFDPTHEAKVLGVVRLPWLGGANVSGVYRYTTGQAWGRSQEAAAVMDEVTRQADVRHSARCHRCDGPRHHEAGRPCARRPRAGPRGA